MKLVLSWQLLLQFLQHFSCIKSICSLKSIVYAAALCIANYVYQKQKKTFKITS